MEALESYKLRRVFHLALEVLAKLSQHFVRDNRFRGKKYDFTHDFF